MAHIEKHHRRPCGRSDCAHGFAKHGKSAKGACTAEGCACSRWISAPGDRETLRARWRDPAGREHSQKFGRMIDAKRFLVSIEDSKLRGGYVDPAAGKIAFRPWAERWYSSTAHLKPSTRHDYRALLDHQVLPRFGGGSLASIDTLAVREWFSVLVAGDPDAKPPRKPIGAKRAHKALQVLVLILGAAVEGKKLAVNPAAGLKRLPRAQRREMHFLDAPQVEVLAGAIREPYGLLVRFAAYTGLRPCELVALRVRQLNLLRGEVRVAEAAPEVGGKLQWGDVKTHEARTIHLPRWLSDELGTYLDGRPRGLGVHRGPGWPAPRVEVGAGRVQEGRAGSERCGCRDARQRAPGRAAYQPALLRPAAHLREPAHPGGRLDQGGAAPHGPQDGGDHPGHLRAPVPGRAAGARGAL